MAIMISILGEGMFGFCLSSEELRTVVSTNSEMRARSLRKSLCSALNVLRRFAASSLLVLMTEVLRRVYSLIMESSLRWKETCF